MVISIRRSRPDEGDKLIAIWCRSVDATHDFLSKSVSKGAGGDGTRIFTGGSAVGGG